MDNHVTELDQATTEGRRWGQRVEVACQTCGLSVSRLVSQISGKRNIYCSKKCYHSRPVTIKATRKDRGTYRSAYATYPCGTCGKDVTRRITDFKEHVYCSRDCYRKQPFKTGKGRPVSPDQPSYETPWGMRSGYNIAGYVYVAVPEHPHKNKGNKVAYHRIVMEKHLGRYLLPHENVHHKNAIRDDNRLDNLELWSSSQPAGGRVEDIVAFAVEQLQLYAPELLK